jgi:hypothetical protein
MVRVPSSGVSMIVAEGAMLVAVEYGGSGEVVSIESDAEIYL